MNLLFPKQIVPFCEPAAVALWFTAPSPLFLPAGFPGLHWRSQAFLWSGHQAHAGPTAGKNMWLSPEPSSSTPASASTGQCWPRPWNMYRALEAQL